MKGVLLHALLAIVGLGWAYEVWTAPAVLEEKPSDEVVLLDCKADQLETLQVELATHTVTLHPTRGKDGVENWMTAQQNKKEEPPPAVDAKVEADKPAADKPAADKPAADKPAANSKAPADKPAPEADKPVPEADKPAVPEKPQARPYDQYAPVVFLASKKLDAVLAGLLPLRALRELGVIEKSRQADFGLDKVTTHLRVACGGQKVDLEVAGRTYGIGDYYVRDPRNDKTYLLSGRLFSDLQSAQFRLMQNDLHDFTLDDVDESVIEAGGKSRRLLHRDRKVKGQAQWVDATAPDRRNELFGNWFDRLGKLRVRTFLARDAAPGADLQIPSKPAVPVVTIEHKLEGKAKGKLELVRVDAVADDASYYYARTEATHAWVTLYDSLAKAVEEDVGLLLGAEGAEGAATEGAGAASSEESAPGP